MVTGRTTEPRTASITLTSGATSLTGASGTFNAADAGRPISGTGVPAGATIASVTNSTTAVLSANATASGAKSLTIGSQPSTVGETNYGFRGWSPETETEAGTYTVAAANAGTATPDKRTDTITGVSQRGRG